MLKGREKDQEAIRNLILTEWDERSNFQFKKATNDSTANKKDFASLESSIITLIKRSLSDYPRLALRSQTKRWDAERIGGNKDTTHDPEIYDDNDFFQTLLKEVMERRSNSTIDPISISKQWLEVQKLRQRRKKSKANVDCKASKGRKTRFVAISKLVNFFPATPESVPWSHEKRDELFKSLFSG